MTGARDPLEGLPDDLARVLRDPSVIVPQDSKVFDLIASWMNAPSNTAPGAIEPCPSCGGEMQPDYRLTVGGRTPWVCSACRAVAVDDNEEPHDSEKDVPVRGDTA